MEWTYRNCSGGHWGALRNNDMRSIRVYTKEAGVTTLGPGKRFCLWVQGCRQRCPGCISPMSREETGGRLIPVNALATEIALSGMDGLTISGGEPFLQSEALAEMIDMIRARRDMGVIVYTGYTIEQLRKQSDAEELLNRTDLLIDGPYIRELDDGLSLRGSSNQRVICLTERYRNALDLYGRDKREVQTFHHGIYDNIVGIPVHQYSEGGSRE